MLTGLPTLRSAYSRAMILFMGALPLGAHPSLERLSEKEMAEIAGRDGIALTVESEGMEADYLGWRTEAGTPDEAMLALGRPNDPASRCIVATVENKGLTVRPLSREPDTRKESQLEATTPH